MSEDTTTGTAMHRSRSLDPRPEIVSRSSVRALGGGLRPGAGNLLDIVKSASPDVNSLPT
jgi:hypothetical protein